MKEYQWEEWDYYPYFERLRKSYDILQEHFATLPFSSIGNRNHSILDRYQADIRGHINLQPAGLLSFRLSLGLAHLMRTNIIPLPIFTIRGMS